MASTSPQPVVDFMLIRSPREIDAERLRRRYIRDDAPRRTGRVDVDLQSDSSPCAVGRLVYQYVFGHASPEAERQPSLIKQVLALLPVRKPANGGDLGPTALPLDLWELERRAHVRVADAFYLLPDRLAYTGASLHGQLEAALPLLAAAAAGDPATRLDLPKLLNRLRILFDGQPLYSAVFFPSGYDERFMQTKRALFDALYVLYLARRRVPLSFEPVMDGLRTLHALEALAVDELVSEGRDGALSERALEFVGLLAREFPALGAWQGGPVSGFPRVGTAGELAELLGARPVVHPIFAQLRGYTRPFNYLRPVGVGDLKLVNQWLLGYEAGEIADIQNVMKGEKRTRTHRRLEKTEETFSSTTSSQQETSTDTQSTDRFELRREAEAVVKNDLSVEANLHAQYSYGTTVVIAATAGVAYKQSTSDQQKLAQTFARDVVDKAVARVQTNTSSQRSITKLFETEETNVHGFENADPAASHVSGIFRWVDKRYRAQVYNYGRRLMFEFVLPEPAAFLVESRLRDFEARLDLPRMPLEPTEKQATLAFSPADISEARFNELRKWYDLSGFTYPARSKTAALVSQEKDGAYFTSATDLGYQDRAYAKSYRCKLESDGYQIEVLKVSGQVAFAAENNGTPQDRNLFKVSIDGQYLCNEEVPPAQNPRVYANRFAVSPPVKLAASDVDVVLEFQDINHYDLTLAVELTITPAALLTWQTKVWNACADVERARVDSEYRELKAGYDADMATYRNRIAEVKATAIHDLIQGRSEAFNRELITTELRRQCLAMLTKEFDAAPSDDLLTNWETMGTRAVDAGHRALEVRTTDSDTSAEFAFKTTSVPFPVPDLPAARDKGRYIQFLEQAFEWSRLGWVCYPYFWATPGKWVELMNRVDDADPNLTAFLRAGAVKVLVAVSPAYDEAVLHFLATREPWLGGQSPVIGDPLYLPLFDEIHEQQDDRFGGVPEGEPWEFKLPTSLVYLHGSTTQLPSDLQPPPSP